MFFVIGIRLPSVAHKTTDWRDFAWLSVALKKREIAAKRRSGGPAQNQDALSHRSQIVEHIFEMHLSR